MNLISTITILFPTLGKFLNLRKLIIIKLSIILSLLILRNGQFSVYGLTLGIPSILAAITFRYSTNDLKFKNQLNFALQFLFPIIAITLFCINPIGKSAFLYSFYWFIPMAIYLLSMFSNKNNYILASISSTFIAHSCGSIIWLYCLPTNQAFWLALIPKVAFERLGIIVGMIITYNFLVVLKRSLKKSQLILKNL